MKKRANWETWFVGCCVAAAIGAFAMILFRAFPSDRENAQRTLAKPKPGYYHASGGARHEVVASGWHMFSDGVMRNGVKLRDESGTEFWVEKVSFDQVYKQRLKA